MPGRVWFLLAEGWLRCNEVWRVKCGRARGCRFHPARVNALFQFEIYFICHILKERDPWPLVLEYVAVLLMISFCFKRRIPITMNGLTGILSYHSAVLDASMKIIPHINIFSKRISPRN